MPSPLPEGEPGEIIDLENLGTHEDISAYRILYHSRNRKGENIAVSGFVLVPVGEAPEGGWPVIGYAHGAVGMADECAPSNFIDTELKGPTTTTSRNLIRLARLGYVVAATDYEGLGTPGLHAFNVGQSAANTVMDSVRAVHNIAELEVSNSWAAVGFSQGGHAVLHTGQYWLDYAPELDLVGVVTIAPGSQFTLLYDALLNSPYRGYIFMTTAAYGEAYDEADVSEVLTPLGISLLEELDNGCLNRIFSIMNSYDVDEISAVENPLAMSPWAEITRENDVNQRAVPVPLFIVHGDADEQIPEASSLLLLSQLCAYADQGPTIRVVYEGASHVRAIDDSADDVIQWLHSRFAGEAARNDCG